MAKNQPNIRNFIEKNCRKIVNTGKIYKKDRNTYRHVIHSIYTHYGLIIHSIPIVCSTICAYIALKGSKTTK